VFLFNVNTTKNMHIEAPELCDAHIHILGTFTNS